MAAAFEARWGRFRYIFKFELVYSRYLLIEFAADSERRRKTKGEFDGKPAV